MTNLFEESTIIPYVSLQREGDNICIKNFPNRNTLKDTPLKIRAYFSKLNDQVEKSDSVFESKTICISLYLPLTL